MAVASLGMLGVLHKVADHRRCRPEAINLFLFLWAGLFLTGFAVFRTGVSTVVSAPATAVAVAAACGTCASLAILHFQHGVRYGRISTSWLIINLSTAVPTVLSIMIYREAVSLRRGISLALAVCALLLLWQDRRLEEADMKETR
jgi:drug/metabolite transporter (DMT)-like permease